MIINDLYNNKKQGVAEANDPNFVGFMNKALGDKVDPKREQPKTGHDWYDNAPTMSMDNMPSYKHAFKFGMSVLQSMDAETKQHFAEADNDELFSYLMKLAEKKGFSPKYFVIEDMIEVPYLFREIFHDPAMQDWEWADLLRSTLKEQGVAEANLGDYRKKAAVSQAGAKIDRFFGRDDPAKVAAADRTIAKREKGLARADARTRPYTPPQHDAEKYQRELTAKYPNIDELVRRAELNRDPDYEMADGQAYYAARDAEHNYHRLKQIQRMIRGAELDEMNFGGVSQTTDSATGDITTSFNQGPVSVSQTKTPGGYTKQTDQQFNLGPATMAQKTVGPNIGAGQLAGTTTRTATNNMTGQSQQQVRGVGFGGATGANVGKNYVGYSDDELAKHAASVFKENVDRITHLAGVKPVR